MTLGGAVLFQDSTAAARRDTPTALEMFNAATSTCGAQKFPLAASLRISLSNVKSDTARRKRSFSFCNRFNSLSWSVPIPPYCLRHRQYVCSLILTARIASARLLPCPTSTSPWRNLLTISSGLCRFVLIFSPPVSIIKGGPIQGGRIRRWKTEMDVKVF